MTSDTRVDKQTAAGGKAGACRWSAGAMVLMMALPMVWGCPDGVEGPPPTRTDEPELELEVTEEDVRALRDGRDDYARPDRQQRRDPFRPNLAVLGVDFEDEAVDEDTDQPREALERYPLSALELVAVISETTTPRAMFIDPSGDGHFAMVGTNVGQNGGQLVSIRPGHLEVRDDHTVKSYPAQVDIDKGEAGIETVVLSDRPLRTPREDEALAEEVQAVLDRLGVPEEEQEEVGRELQDEGLVPEGNDGSSSLVPPRQD